jgi:predicted acetylornithine/succinylornithine family transaminase
VAVTMTDMAGTQQAGALLGVYKRAAPMFVAGRGCRLIDDEGREYLDFTSGIGVNALGYGDAGLAQAISDALDTGLIHISNLFRTEPGERLAQELVSRSFADKVFFCNSGGEAMEGALKFARRWATDRGGAEKHEIVALRGSFHGRLFGSLAITDRPAYRAPFAPLMPGARFALPELAAVREAVSRASTAAIVLEPVQGEGGIIPLAPELLRDLRALADEIDALLIFDEVQCGLGRTGRLFAHENAGVTPDILTLAKPIAGGLPMGAVLLTDRVAAALKPGDHATTFGGGPLVASAALAVLQRVADPALLERVRAGGAQIARTTNAWVAEGRIRQARGIGLMWGLELEDVAAPVVARALEAGLLILTAGERVLRLLPPLVIEPADIDQGLGLLRDVL